MMRRKLFFELFTGNSLHSPKGIAFLLLIFFNTLFFPQITISDSSYIHLEGNVYVFNGAYNEKLASSNNTEPKNKTVVKSKKTKKAIVENLEKKVALPKPFRKAIEDLKSSLPTGTITSNNHSTHFGVLTFSNDFIWIDKPALHTSYINTHIYCHIKRYYQKIFIEQFYFKSIFSRPPPSSV